MQRIWRHRFLLLLPVAAVGLAAAAFAVLLDGAALRLLYSEDHLIENATVLFYGVAIVLLLVWSGASWRLRVSSAAVMVLCAARELDLHNAFTAESLLKISYYQSDADPLGTRVLAGLCVFAILALLAGYAGYARRLVAALRQARPAAYPVLAAIVALVFSKTLDSGPRMIHKHLGIDFGEALRGALQVTEESLELMVPLLVILSVLQSRASLARR